MQTSKTDQNMLIVKTTVFDVPREVWRSGFNAFQMSETSTITFADYARQRENPEFIRDFNLACSRQPHLILINTVTNDLAHVNKGFLDSMFFDQSVQEEPEDEQSRYAFLASDDHLNADAIDFSDPSAILRR